ncbi:MAG: hypothetical protein HQ513_07265 [Rhodospirillales bacterium]|nr:hypothetical protein [Rhodospirillales bacterium]
MLIRELRALLDAYPNDSEVRIAHQPLWPFEYEVRGLVATGELTPPQGGQAPNLVWIVEGKLIGPISDQVWRAEFQKRGG